MIRVYPYTGFLLSAVSACQDGMCYKLLYLKTLHCTITGPARGAAAASKTGRPWSSSTPGNHQVLPAILATSPGSIAQDGAKRGDQDMDTVFTCRITY